MFALEGKSVEISCFKAIHKQIIKTTAGMPVRQPGRGKGKLYYACY